MKNNASVRKSKVDLDPPDALLKTKEIELDAKRASSSSSSSSSEDEQTPLPAVVMVEYEQSPTKLGNQPFNFSDLNESLDKDSDKGGKLCRICLNHLDCPKKTNYNVCCVINTTGVLSKTKREVSSLPY